MANLALVYGMRLLPSDELVGVQEGTIRLQNGRDAHVTLHVLEGSKEDIQSQLNQSIEAFFDIYPEI
ncbi:MAG TPA: allantoinase [Terriglobales bacterium]